MNPSSFVHLHSHSEYSLLDGAARLTDDKGKPGELPKKVAAMGQPALALTDHGNLYGAIEFYQSCKAVNVKPILGCEMYIAPKSRFDKTSTGKGGDDAYYHFTLLARDNEGYQNLIQLVSLGFLEGYYYKPRVDKELLAKYGKGLIALSGCLKGELAEKVLADREADALKVIDDYQSIFGKENYYLELMDHGIQDQRRQNEKLIALSRKTGIPLVATNDCHYLDKKDAGAHDALLCIGTGSMLDEPDRMRFSDHEFYYKSVEEMRGVFQALPEAVTRTLEIAERCQVDIRFDQMHLPYYEVPSGETADSYLEKLCLQGLERRYGAKAHQFHERLQYELSVIRKMGFSAYFLIVWDFVHFAKNNGVPVGPGRGSGAGALVSYVLGITDVCPMKYGLLFERFLNPDRRTMPDLDIDFSDEGREKVIDYVRQKYGDKSVAQIITFGSMLARLVVRDVGRVMGFPVSEVDRIAKMIPKELGTTIEMARKSVPEINQEAKANPQVAKLLDTAQRLEGLKRHTGVHAAGIVIAKGDLTQYVPLARGAKDVITTQYNDEALLKLGMLKMDFLGLRTLSVIDHCCRYIRERHRPDFDIRAVPLDDAPTFKLLQDAKAIGVFQLESSGMRDLLRRLKPAVFEEIIALIALYRPGPMGAGMLDEFVKRKFNPSSIKYDHPVLEPILKETYGIILYQEQAMQISRAFAGFTPGEADVLRKAMSKKIPEEIEKLRGKFIDGAKAQGIKEKTAQTVFEQIVTFGGYGFNKSHSTAYGLVSYQTAYLKANFPVEFMAASLTSEIGHSAIGKEEDSKIVVFLNETESMGIRVLPPDVQTSEGRFSIEPAEGKPAIRFGLLAVKNVGEGAVESIIEARRRDGPFKSFEEFCQRIDLRQANRKVLESLVKAGAFDAFSKQPPKAARAHWLLELDLVMERSASLRQDADAGQHSLFGWDALSATAKARSAVPLGGSSVPEPGSGRPLWSDQELLACEKEVLGFYLSGHPLARFQAELRQFSTHRLTNLPSSGTTVRLAGMISSVRRMVTKAKKEPYARCRFEDLEGEIDVVVFPKAYAGGIAVHLKPSEMVVLTGKVNRRMEEAGAEILVEDLVPMAVAREKYVSEIVFQLSGAVDSNRLEEMKQAFSRFPGQCRVCFELETGSEGRVVVETDFRVKPSAALLQEIERQLGPECWRMTRVGR